MPKVMAIILSRFLPCSDRGGWEMAWRTLDDALLVTLLSARDGRPVLTSVWMILLSLVLTSRGVVMQCLIGEALSYPCPISLRTGAWTIGHVYPCGSHFDRWWSPYLGVGRLTHGSAWPVLRRSGEEEPSGEGRARQSLPAVVDRNKVLARGSSKVEATIGGPPCLGLGRA